MNKINLVYLIILLFLSNLYGQKNPYIPLSQPFNRPPWNYNGTESVSVIPDSVVDWVLVELRGRYSYQLNAQESLYRRAAFLKMDNTIVSINNDTIKYGTTFEDQRWNNIPRRNESGDFYYVIYHRNHLPVMSAKEVKFMEGQLSVNYDFTNPSKVWKDTLSLSKSKTGGYAMVSGDVNADGIVNILDYIPIQRNLFTSGYKMEDTNNDGQVNVLDYAGVYKNLFKVNLLPKLYIRREVIPFKITASSFVNPYTPQKTTDGINSINKIDSGRWKSANGMPQWILFEFDREVYIEDISINFYLDATNSNGIPLCYIETSSDSINWYKPIFYDYYRHPWVQVPVGWNAKYVKLNIQSINAPYQYISIWEVDFYTYSPN